MNTERIIEAIEAAADRIVKAIESQPRQTIVNIPAVVPTFPARPITYPTYPYPTYPQGPFWYSATTNTLTPSPENPVQS